jgi:ADP-ribose pyrophosphatase YjhB (NUDIX family)
MKSHGVVVIIRKDNKYFLLKDSRELMRGKWGPPHGRCSKKDMTEQDSVIRETYEETNLKVKPIKILWSTRADTKVKTVSFWLAEIVEGKIKIDKKESSDYGWFTIDKALTLNLYPGTKKFLKLVKKGTIDI